MRFPFSNPHLLYIVVSLISLDVVITMIGVGLMGATELNPIVGVFGFTGFMVVKVVTSAVAIYVLFKHIAPVVPTAARCGAMVLCGVYGVICASNIYQVVGVII